MRVLRLVLLAIMSRSVYRASLDTITSRAIKRVTSAQVQSAIACSATLPHIVISAPMGSVCQPPIIRAHLAQLYPAVITVLLSLLACPANQAIISMVAHVLPAQKDAWSATAALIVCPVPLLTFLATF